MGRWGEGDVTPAKLEGRVTEVSREADFSRSIVETFPGFVRSCCSMRLAMRNEVFRSCGNETEMTSVPCFAVPSEAFERKYHDHLTAVNLAAVVEQWS